MFVLASNVCESASFLATVLFIKKLVKILSIVIPVLLVLFVTIDMVKAVIASDDNGIKKAQSLAIKRIIYALVIFFVPVIVNAIFNALSENGVEGLSCYSNAEDEVVDALAKAEKESLLKYEEDINKLIEAAKDSKAAADMKLAELRQKSVNGYNVSNITNYTKSNGYVAHATSGSRGRYDKKGDQSGKEVTVSKNKYKWTYIARFKDPSKAAVAAKCMEQGAANNHIGYGVNDYTSLYYAAKKVNWDLSKITTDVNTVCSAFVSVCINAAGVPITKDLNGFSSNVKTKLKNTGAFEILPYNKNNLNRGDVLVIAKQHVGMAL